MDLISLDAKDFGPFKHIFLPLQKQGLVWIGGVNKDTKAAKSNGSGKTNISRALTWCLWGETIDGEKGDKVIRHGTKKAHVVTELEGGWRVDRQRTKGAPKLQLIQPDGKAFKASKGDIQAKIDEMIGLDFKAFKNTVLYGQNDSSRFVNPRTTDAERKDMLHRIMRTEILKHCHEHVKEQAKIIRGEITDIESELSTVQARIDEHDVEGLEEQSKEWQQQRLNQISHHKAQAKEHSQQAKDEMEGAVSDEAVEALKAKVKKLKTTVDKGTKAEKLADEADAEVDALADDISGLSKKVSKTEAIQDQLDEQLDQLSGDNCPVCSTPMSGAHAKKHKKDLTAKHDSAVKDQQQLGAQISDLETQKDALKAAMKKHKAASREGRLAAQDIGNLKDEITEAQAAGAQADHYVELARKELTQAKALRDQDNPYQEQIEAAHAQVEKHREAHKRWRRQLKEKQDGLGHVQFWVRGFSGQGLPSFILDSVMPLITERSNHYLDTLADGDITMRFDTQRELKSSKGEYRDNIDIDWTIEGIDGYPASGGQLNKMELAGDLALMDLVATREGARLDLLMLDEVLDGLDDEGRQRVLQLLHELRGRFGSVFVISHETDIAEVFEKAITTVKEGGVSELEVAM